MKNSKPPRPCKHCGEAGTHLEFTCFKKPKKGFENHGGKKWNSATKRMNKIGPVTRKWIATKEKWFIQNKAPYYHCYLCDKLMTRTQLTLDHVKSRSRHPELRFSLKNLEPCCWDCNGRKGSLSLEEYRAKNN